MFAVLLLDHNVVCCGILFRSMLSSTFHVCMYPMCPCPSCRYMEDYVEDDGPRPSRQALLTGRLGGFNYELGDSGDDDDVLPGRRK